jgi:plastocyanin
VRPVLLVLAIAGAAILAAPATAAAPKPRTVKIADNYYAPAKLSVKRGTRVIWRWPAEAGDVHDVKLKSGPKGVRRFKSEPASAGYSFRRTLKVPGRYRIVCTLHEEMTMTVTVTKP